MARQSGVLVCQGQGSGRAWARMAMGQGARFPQRRKAGLGGSGPRPGAEVKGLRPGALEPGPSAKAEIRGSFFDGKVQKLKAVFLGEESQSLKAVFSVTNRRN